MTLQELDSILSPNYAESGFCGLEIRPGWVDLVYQLHLKLVTIDPGYRIVQIKSKFGLLRYYCFTNESDIVADAIADAINAAEEESGHVCEDCGARGRSVNVRHWFFTLCADCESKRRTGAIKNALM